MLQCRPKNVGENIVNEIYHRKLKCILLVIYIFLDFSFSPTRAKQPVHLLLIMKTMFLKQGIRFQLRSIPAKPYYFI
jgi:hypothetical protein